MSKCKYCPEIINWKYPYGQVPDGGRNTPLNLDGTVHVCRRPESSSLESVEPPVSTGGSNNGKPLATNDPRFADAYNDLLEAVGKDCEAFYKKVTGQK